MPRIHAFELEDQTWCPVVIRDAATDYLRVIQQIAKPYQSITEILIRAVVAAQANEIIDLCSGGAGSWLYILPRLQKRIPNLLVRLTDKFPNIAAFEKTSSLLGSNAIAFDVHEVDARAVPADLRGFRTMFTALHHFRPQDVQAILNDAAQRKCGFAAFECTSRSVRAFLMIFCTPLFVALLTPWIRPFRWSRLFWTYVIPAVPFLACFDGLISCLRTYTVAELTSLTKHIEIYDYHWDIGQVTNGILPLTYIVGAPTSTVTE